MNVHYLGTCLHLISEALLSYNNLCRLAVRISEMNLNYDEKHLIYLMSLLGKKKLLMLSGSSVIFLTITSSLQKI